MVTQAVAGFSDTDTFLDDPARRAALLRTVRRVEAEPALLGATGHLMAIATTP